MDGELTLRIDGDGASIRTFYGKLIPRFEDLEEDDDVKLLQMVRQDFEEADEHIDEVKTQLSYYDDDNSN